jgi:hypothetical protein
MLSIVWQQRSMMQNGCDDPFPILYDNDLKMEFANENCLA